MNPNTDLLDDFLDEEQPVKQESYIPIIKLAFSGAFFTTLSCLCILYLESIVFLIIPLLLYIALHYKYREELFTGRLRQTLFISGAWLGIPSIPVLTLLLVS